MTVWNRDGFRPVPLCLAKMREAAPVASPAAPRPTPIALAVTPPTRPPTIPPSPRSTLGDRVVVKTIVEVSSSLATVTILDTTGVVVPPGAMIVEKLPTRELMTPVLMVEALMVENVPTPDVIVEVLRVLKVRTLGRVKDDTASVEAVISEVLTVEALSEEMVKAPGRVKDDTLIVEKEPI